MPQLLAPLHPGKDTGHELSQCRPRRGLVGFTGRLEVDVVAHPYGLEDVRPPEHGIAHWRSVRTRCVRIQRGRDKLGGPTSSGQEKFKSAELGALRAEVGEEHSLGH